MKGIEAPICQDTCSGGLGAALAHAEVCHHALVAFTSKEAFEASNDLALGPAISGAACDVVVCENSAEQALREAAPVARPADARCAGLRRAPRQPSALLHES